MKRGRSDTQTKEVTALFVLELLNEGSEEAGKKVEGQEIEDGTDATTE